LNIEDIEIVSKKVRDLYQSVREGNVRTVADIQSKVQDIRRMAVEKNVPIFIDEKELIKIMQTSEIGVPEEYEEEESSESEEYEEEEDEEDNKED
jgi:Zn-finger nucleic acid-binding protein